MMERIRVMIAEDEPYLCEKLARWISECDELELVGYSHTGEGIVRLAGEKSADVILMDIEMESSDSGLVAAEKIVAANPQIIIIFITVHEEDDLIYRAFEIGPNIDYIVKSNDKDKVITKIIDIYSGRKSVDPDIVQRITDEFVRMRRNQGELMRFFNILFTITPSEKELIRLLLAGWNIKQIAEKRYVEVSTVKTQINTLLKKFGMSRTKEIVNYIRRIKVESFFNEG